MAKAKQFEVAIKATVTIIVEAETAAEAEAKALDDLEALDDFDEFEVEWTEKIEEDDD